MTLCLLQHQDYKYQLQSQNSTILLQMLLKFTCTKTNGLPPDMCPTVAATHSSSPLSSVSLLSGFVIGQSLSVTFQPAVICACVDVVPVCSRTIDLPSFCAPVPWFVFRSLPRLFSSCCVIHHPFFQQFLLPP